MKFSFTLLKQLVPQLPRKERIEELLTLHTCEVERGRGETLEVSIPPNRFSDLGSHWGLAREIAAVAGSKVRLGVSSGATHLAPKKKMPQRLRIVVGEPALCARYAAQYFEHVSVTQSPAWMRRVLRDCGTRPINNVVDTMNYVTLETGQPLHAFDFDKLTGGRRKTIEVRRARHGESLTTLDGKTYAFSPRDLVIADTSRILAIAGVKGGQYAGVERGTTRVVVEAANFNAESIYRTSKALKLATDASLRFSHRISPELVSLGLCRAGELLHGIARAIPGKSAEVASARPSRKIIAFPMDRYHRFIGSEADTRRVRDRLGRLGFSVRLTDGGRNKDNALLVEPSAIRDDVAIFEDVAEEAARLAGYSALRSAPPQVALHPSGYEDAIVLKDKIRNALLAVGMSELVNYSFLSKEDVYRFGGFGGELAELENPISAEFLYLRPSLAPGLVNAALKNFRFFDHITAFEMGRIFSENEEQVRERSALGMVRASKEGKETFFSLKGIMQEMLKRVGLVDARFVETGGDRMCAYAAGYAAQGGVLVVKAGNEVIGYVAKVTHRLSEKSAIAVAEIDCDTLLRVVQGEHEYKPLSKYPSVMRDISIVVPPSTRIGGVMQAIQEVDTHIIENVDIIDEYGESVTFRIIFQAENRTLTDKEVNRAMDKVRRVLHGMRLAIR